MKTRLPAFALVLASLVMGTAPCVGWASTPEARHGCCAEGQCPDEVSAATGTLTQDAADRCCASSEDRKNAEGSQGASVVASTSIASPAATATFNAAMLASQAVATRPLDAIPAGTRSVPRHLLLSVFLV